MEKLLQTSLGLGLGLVDLGLQMSSDFNYNFGFVVKEIFELGHSRKSRCSDN